MAQALEACGHHLGRPPPRSRPPQLGYLGARLSHSVGCWVLWGSMAREGNSKRDAGNPPIMLEG